MKYLNLFFSSGVVCSTCAKKKTGVGFISENRERIGKVLEKVSSGIKTIEISASERLSQIGEMRNRKRKFHETQFNFDKNRVAMPPLLRELFENTLSAHKVRIIFIISKQILLSNNSPNFSQKFVITIFVEIIFG